MTDPAAMPSPASTSKQLNKVFLFASIIDILTGLVLAAVGVNMDEQALVVGGVVLALIGTAVTCFLIIRTSKPEQL